MLPAAPELSSAAFYIAAGNYRKKTKRGLNWQEMEMDQIQEVLRCVPRHVRQR